MHAVYFVLSVTVEVPPGREVGQGPGGGRGRAADPGAAAEAVVAAASPNPSHQTASPDPSHLQNQGQDPSRHQSPGQGQSLVLKVQATKMIKMIIRVWKNKNPRDIISYMCMSVCP